MPRTQVEKGSSSAAPDSVMVAVRCRPFNQREKDQKEGKVITIKEGGYCGIDNPSEPDAPPREPVPRSEAREPSPARRVA